jgi:predicted nucleotidyltransferase
MSLEEKLARWTGPSSDTEQEKQERTERMVREAIDEHQAFANCALRVYAKGSYANNTNVRADSDVDIAVECTEAIYWDTALRRKFGNSADVSGTTAVRVHSSSARVDADVVPCFSYKYHLSRQASRPGTKIFKTDGKSIVNYPAQQLANGTEKNRRTEYAYKRTVRILKRAENATADTRTLVAVPSYFIECLTYNCPDSIFLAGTWTDTVRSALIHIWNATQGDEPAGTRQQRWVEVNECFYLFHPSQRWTRADARAFAQAVWNYFGFS